MKHFLSLYKYDHINLTFKFGIYQISESLALAFSKRRLQFDRITFDVISIVSWTNVSLTFFILSYLTLLELTLKYLKSLIEVLEVFN